jgi:serine/threonine protein kinase
MTGGRLPDLGETIADRTLVRRIGEGSMGVVFEAHGPNGDAPTAIKVLKPEVARDDAAVAEFGDEAHATGAIDHENVVTILDRGVDRELHYIVMELVDGPPLDRLLQAKGRLPFKPVVKIGIQLAAALGHAHAQGLVHRDVKPANVLLYKNGRARLTDFGIVKDIGSLQGYLLRGRRVGTASYASPEQCLDKRLSEATDVYSLGATLYHALCGKAPFNGGSPQEIARRHVHTTPVPPCEAVPEVPRSLSKLVERMLAKRQADRPTTERVVHDLGCVLKGKVAIATGPAAPRVNPAALKGLRRTGIRGRRAASRG